MFADLDRKDSPGCALGVLREGVVVYARGYGMANLEHAIAISPSSVFDIGSMSKQFTALSVALLAREGRLSLDDDIRKHLPEMPAYAEPITIRHLLHHTSGLRDYTTYMSLAGWRTEDVATDEEAFDLITRQKGLNHRPGHEYLYCNTGYFLLSQIVRRVSGQSLRDFADARIFRPLGMATTALPRRPHPDRSRAHDGLHAAGGRGIRHRPVGLGADRRRRRPDDDRRLWPLDRQLRRSPGLEDRT